MHMTKSKLFVLLQENVKLSVPCVMLRQLVLSSHYDTVAMTAALLVRFLRYSAVLCGG